MGYYRRKKMGLGRTPLQKVETTTKGIVTFTPTQPKAPVLTTNTYVPPVSNNWWQNIGKYVPDAINFATPFVQNAVNRGGNSNFQNQAPASVPGANGNNIDAGSNKNSLGDIIKDNPVAVGVGVLAVGLLAVKALK